MRDFEGLLRDIKEWQSNDPPYDFVAACQLLMAILRNIEDFALEAELEDVGLYIESRDFDMIEKVLNYRYTFDD